MLAIFRFLPDSITSGRWRSSPSPTLVRAVAWFVAALVVGGVLASWFWQLAAPDTAPQSETAPLLDHQAAATAVVARHLFGRPSSVGDEKGGERGGASLRLLGAMTASPEAAGFAILAEEGKPSMAAIEGETFMPGTTLMEVLPGQVRVKIGERVETIEMTKSATTVQPTSGERSGAARPGFGPRPEGVRP